MRLVALVLLLAACSKESSAPTPGPAPGSAHVDDGKRKAGASCKTDAECSSGICEGQGCEANFTGSCAEPQRECTPDHVEFCMCDGTTGGYSSTCPPPRYRHEGPCEPTTPVDAATAIDAAPVIPKGKLADGEKCSTANACASGFCSISGCAATGVCAPPPKPRGPCTPDVVYYCGCDGRDLTGSSNCPPLNYRHRGNCASK